MGKSSTINALFGSKKTAVAPTPGKTKHFQTLNITDKLTLCDCPGLVLPRYAQSKSEMVAAGMCVTKYMYAQLHDASELAFITVCKQEQVTTCRDYCRVSDYPCSAVKLNTGVWTQYRGVHLHIFLHRSVTMRHIGRD